jgi:inner membrane protein
MATVYTHAVAGLGIARLCAVRPMPWSYWILAVVLPVVPDLDVFSMAPYGSPLGHRGITHSLVFALALGLVVASITSRPLRMRWWILAGLLFAIVASHGLLDALTRGGENVPFFWPLKGRYGNWGPIPVSDIAFDWPDPRRSRSVRSELLWVWLPMTLLVAMVMAYRRWTRAATSTRC